MAKLHDETISVTLDPETAEKIEKVSEALKGLGDIVAGLAVVVGQVATLVNDWNNKEEK